MFTKTICTPGAPITVVPEGLLAVLKYNSNGQLECVQLGYDPINFQLVSTEVLNSVKRNQTVPLSINITGATSYVYGLFYCNDDVVVSGVIPTALRESLLEKLEASPDKFIFLASHPVSMGANFQAHVAIRNWLQMNGFSMLPTIVATNDVNDDSMFELLKHRFKNFRWPIASGYWIEKSGNLKFIPSNMRQYKIKKVKQIINSHGVVSAEVKFDNGEIMMLPWSVIIDFDLDSDTAILIDNQKIVSSRRYISKNREVRTREFVCPTCGKKQIIEYNQGIVECEDDNCQSKLYSKICQFNRVLGLPEMTEAAYSKHRSASELTCISDLFMISPYDDEQVVCSFPKLLEAVISPTSVPQPHLFQQFADSCSNTMKTLSYYIQNPSEISHDLNIKSPFLSKFIQWLKDGQNILMLQTLMNHPQIRITFSGKRFEGAPIFRGKKICVTGQFIHGDLQDIIAILKSYDAEVTTIFTDTVHCVLVGDTHANIDGSLIHAARQTNIPVFEESDFFAQYEIDADLNANLQ